VAFASRKLGHGIFTVPATMPFSWRSTTTKRAVTTMAAPRPAEQRLHRRQPLFGQPDTRAEAQDERAPGEPADQVAGAVAQHGARPHAGQHAADGEVAGLDRQQAGVKEAGDPGQEVVHGGLQEGARRPWAKAHAPSRAHAIAAACIHEP
jgi:hypothetical protein